MQTWEYLTIFVEADAEREALYLVETRTWKDGIPKNTPEAMIPQLNALGAQGWELVHMQPVYAGKKADVLTHAGNERLWTANYFCAFKRPKGA
jgi:hypothetical protein